MTTTVGIERLAVYVPPLALRLEDLAVARGVPPQKMTAGLGVHEMAIASPCEDVVTLAATAGARVLRAAGVDPREIGMLLVATETGVDHAKPVGIFVHELLGIGPRCRVFELKHACYAGTAALMTAADWVRSGRAAGRKALVIAADIARYAIGSAGEPTQGAGAAAMIVGDEPRVLALGERSATYAASVYDFWRPHGRREALVDGKFSVECYLGALRAAFGEFRAAEGLGDDACFSDRVARLLYHCPFPKMAVKAHRALMEDDLRAAPHRWARVESALDAEIAASFERLVEPALTAARRVGNTYTASLYVCLADTIERHAAALAGTRLGLFSYGSGSCAEYFDGMVPREVERVADTGVAASLAGRTLLDVDAYERLMRAGEGGGEAPAGFAGEFVFHGVADDRRRYGRTTTSLAA